MNSVHKFAHDLNLSLREARDADHDDDDDDAIPAEMPKYHIAHIAGKYVV